jgi:hypothetical protein
MGGTNAGTPLAQNRDVFLGGPSVSISTLNF